VELTRLQIFEKLQDRVDPKVLEERQQAINERVNAIYQKAQVRLAELVCITSLDRLAWRYHRRTGELIIAIDRSKLYPTLHNLLNPCSQCPQYEKGLPPEDIQSAVERKSRSSLHSARGVEGSLD